MAESKSTKKPGKKLFKTEDFLQLLSQSEAVKLLDGAGYYWMVQMAFETSSQKSLDLYEQLVTEKKRIEAIDKDFDKLLNKTLSALQNGLQEITEDFQKKNTSADRAATKAADERMANRLLKKI